MKKFIVSGYTIPLSLSLTLLLTACGGSDNSASNKDDNALVYPDYTFVKDLGGTATAENASDSGHGFSQPIATLTASELEDHLTGDTNFETAFTTAPNNEHPELDGLGPVFNNQDCNSCHQRDGRSSTITLKEGEERTLLGADAGIFLRISLDDGDCAYPLVENNYCQNTPVPDFGTQLFHRGVLKAREDWQQHAFVGQANVYLSYQYSTQTYPDGNEVTLKKPIFAIEDAFDAPRGMQDSSNLSQSDVRFSPRTGMPVFGLGLLELISEQDILALTDEDDVDNDSISGRANWVYDPVKAQQLNDNPVSLGRFGWKASTPSVRVQSLGALRGDMGITNPLFPDESIANTSMHDSYLARTNYLDTGVDENGETEASADFSDTVVFYAETLAVPARRNIDNDDIKMGAVHFNAVGCTSCHTPAFTTQTGNVDIGGVAAPESLKGQTIYPFTDMLLHDMGDDLADNRRDFLASGQEWKTRPLWGIGLTKTVNPAAGFLHDGRADTIEEAILWHGGEANNSRQAFKALSVTERKQLLSFVQSL